MTLSIRTNSARIVSPPVFKFTRSTNAGGKLPSWPKRIPIFFIREITADYADDTDVKKIQLASLIVFLGHPRYPRNPRLNICTSYQRQIIGQHVAPVVPIVAAPAAVVEKMLDPFRVQDFR